MSLTIRKYTVCVGCHFLKRLRSSSSIVSQNHLESLPDISDEVTKNHAAPTKFLKVAFIGLPNAGKSTLVNRLSNRTLCPTSSKVHTTLRNAEVAYVEGNTQIVFLDTPGTLTPHEVKKYKMENSRHDLSVSMKKADVAGIVHDAHNVFTRQTLNIGILTLIAQKRPEVPLLLILNKVDKIRNKEILLEITKTLTSIKDIPKFDDIFMISALNGDGINDLRSYLMDSAKSKDWQYDVNFHTDKSQEKIVAETVRAKCMEELPHEIPYKISTKVSYLNALPDGTIQTYVVIECPHKRIHYLLLRGGRIGRIARMTEMELQNAFRTNVLVKLESKIV